MRFMRYRHLYFLFSLLFIIPSIWFLATSGLKPAIDFTGGSLFELIIQTKDKTSLSEEALQQSVGSAYELNSIQFTDQQTIIIRTRPLSQEEKQVLIKNVESGLGQVTELRFETVGPTIGRELLQKTVTGILLAAVLILLYVAYRFSELKYGVCAILAMFHDTLILLGVFSALGKFLAVEVDTLFVTAVLTTLSFSVHDTIVVYDRIREAIKQHPLAEFEDLVDVSVSETLGRSLNNSFTIIFMLVALLLFGGVTIRWFVLALLVGTISGTYSSTFTAAPLLVIWEKRKKKKTAVN